MEVSHDEGLASHIGPEPCDGGREAAVEASVGEHAGQPLSRESFDRSADSFRAEEGNTMLRGEASTTSAPRGLRPWHAREASWTGTGRSRAWPPRKRRSASGRR